MAVITPSKLTTYHRCEVWKWEGITQNDSGAGQRIEPELIDKTVFFGGTINGSTFKLECSPDGQNWWPAQDADGNAIHVTSTGASFLVRNAAPFWRIGRSGTGTNESAHVWLVCVGRGA